MHYYTFDTDTTFEPTTFFYPKLMTSLVMNTYNKKLQHRI